jgi:uncharacterized protein (TIGR03086 family)
MSDPERVDVVVTRVLDAPVAEVWNAWTDPEYVTRWWGPDGFVSPLAEMDVRVGGTSLVCMSAPGFGEMYNTWRYERIEPERLIEFVLSFADKDRAILDPASLGIQGVPREVRHVITIEARDTHRTELTVREFGYLSEQAAELSKAGLEQSLDKMGAFLEHRSMTARYHRHADEFERKVAAVRPEQWSNQSPCEKWDARAVVDHIVIMHAAMLRPAGRELSPAPSVAEDPLSAFQAARADVEAVLDDPDQAADECDTPAGKMTIGQHIDQVVSDDLVLHGWDVARATGQDDTIDPADLERLWAITTAIPDDLMRKYRTPGAFGPGIEVYGPEVDVPESAPLQHRLLGLFGRDPHWPSRNRPVAPIGRHPTV